MNEQLIVKNFGPIKDATVDFKKVTVFIGPTGGGKSTLAKLATIFRDNEFHYSPPETTNDFFNKFSIGNYFKTDSHLSWSYKDNELIIKDRKLSLNENFYNSFNELSDKHTKNKLESLAKYIFEIARSKNLTYDDFRNTHEFDKVFDDYYRKNILSEVYKESIAKSLSRYIPSERSFIPAIEYSWAGILRDDIGLPKSILDFANMFNTNKKSISQLPIPFLDVEYLHQNGQDFIKTSASETLLRLYETASGIQSVTPMLVLLEFLFNQQVQDQSFIIEEPELNLYPTAQQGLINWLVERCTTAENDLTITTHSPYILSHLNLLLYAYQVAEKHPDRADDVAKIVPRESWINPKEFAAYHVEGQKENGIHSIVNPETGLISYNDLDALAGNSATEFDQLLDINAGLEVE